MADLNADVAAVREVRDVLNVNERKLRHVRDRIDPFEQYNDGEFRKRYRLTKETVRYVVEVTADELETNASHSSDISPTLQVLVALRFYAKGCYQTENADLHGLSQSAVSRIVAKVSRVLASKLPQFVKFPARLDHLKTRFYNIRQVPNVVGCVDCTHIRIKNPNKNVAMLYCNRKGFYSLNVQVVCDADCNILDIVARWRGSAHDARIWDQCTLKQEFEASRINGILLGDGGYPCTRYMLTPLLNPQTPAEVAYNRSHISTRSTVERCFGQWKGMFRALQNGLQISLPTAKAAIIGMTVLFNIRKSHGEDDEYSSDSDPEDISDDEDNMPTAQVQPDQPGNIFRRQFIRDHFTP